MPVFWIVLIFRGKKTFEMLHKSRWNVKVYITLTIMTRRSILKVTWRSRQFFLNWTLCPDNFFFSRLQAVSYKSYNLDDITCLWLFTNKKDTLSLLLALLRNKGVDVVSSVSFGVHSCREFPLALTLQVVD